MVIYIKYLLYSVWLVRLEELVLKYFDYKAGQTSVSLLNSFHVHMLHILYPKKKKQI